MCLGELHSVFHTLAFPKLGKWVMSSGLLDPAAGSGSEAKANWDLHRKSRPLDTRGAGGRGRVSGCLLPLNTSPPCEVPFQPFKRPLCQAHLCWIPQLQSHSLGGVKS